MDLDDSELFWTKVKNGVKKITQEDLERFQQKYFILEMKDNWDSSDYKYAAELRSDIKKCKEILM